MATAPKVKVARPAAPVCMGEELSSDSGGVIFEAVA